MRKKIRRFLSISLVISMLAGLWVPVHAQETAGQMLPKANMSAEASSAGGAAYTAEKAIDGNESTIWHGRWEGDDIPPHWITVQLDKDQAEVKPVREIVLTSRNDVNPGHESINNVTCTIWTSTDGVHFEEAVKDQKLNNGGGAKTSIHVNRKASHIKITGSSNFMAIAEIDVSVYGDDVDLTARIELEERIKEAERILEEAVTGTDFNQYPKEAWTLLKDVVEKTREALLGDEEQVKQGREELEQALLDFENAKRIFSASDYQDLIREAEALNNRIQVGSESGNCPEEAKTVFSDQITEAKKYGVETDSEKLYEEYKNLKKAISDFTNSILFEDENDSIDISGTWQFEMTSGEEAESLNETVKLPGTMDENGKGNDNTSNISPTYLNRDYIYTGAATYQREIEIPADWDGKHITLFMERTRKTRVWVDGVQVGSGQQKSYTNPHEYDLTGYVKPGKKHVLTVEVDNSPKDMPEALYTTFEKDFPWAHMVSEHTQTNWNGILGEIKIEAAPAVYVETFKIRPDVDHGTARVTMEIRRTGTEGVQEGTVGLRAESYNNDGRTHTPEAQSFSFRILDGQDSTELTMEYQMGSDVLLWDEFSPTLYEMTAVLRSETGGEFHACVEKESFGMRKFEALYREDGGKQFAVNGRATQLRGEINCAVFPMTGYAPMDLDSWLKVMQTYKDYGLNHVRFHTWVPPMAAFEAADRLGLYIQYELPQWGYKMFGDIDKGDTSAADYYWDETTGIFDNYLNSPSAVMMGLGNELRPGFYYYDEFLGRCSELEPELLYTDIAGWSAYTENVEFANSVPTRGANYLHRVEPATNWDHWDNTRKTPVPFLAHEPGQLQVYPDYEEEIAKYYEKNSLLKPRNLEYFQKILESAGMGDMSAKFSQSSGELSAMLYRYMTEGYLRTPGAGGFQLLGLQDFSGQGTALVGMLDAFMESKGDVTPEEFRQSCSELTVLGKMSKFVWENNETFTADIVIPNYSAADAETSVSWTLRTEEGELVESGTLEKKNAVQGEVNGMGTVSADLSGVKTAQKLELCLEMDQKPGKETAPYAVGTNNYSIWVYPAEISEDTPEEISVYTQFTNQAKKDLEDGKSVLIVSTGTKDALPKSKAVTFRPDFWSPMFHSSNNDGYVLGCYIDETHPVFENFPTGIFGDWQWYDLISNSRSILLEGAPASLKPMVQAIPTIDLGDRMGTLFEAKVGKGKLVVSSIDLLGNESPAAKQLLYSIKEYMVSDKFDPQAELDAEYVRELLPTNDMKGISAEVKENLEIGETSELKVKSVDYQGSVADVSKGAHLIYKSQNEEIASVTEDGVVEGISAGMTEILVQMTNEGIVYETKVVVVVGAAQAEKVANDAFTLNVSSSDASFPKEYMIDGNENTFWHSDYTNAEQKMPQEVEAVFTEPTEISGILCKARKDNIGGSILKASVLVRRSGCEEYETVIEHAEFGIRQAELFFAIPKTEADSVKIIIEEAVMDSQSTNAAAIAELEIYKGDMVTAVQEFPVQEVRFGTTLEKVLKRAPLPESVEVTVNGTETERVPVIWNTSSYNPNLAGEYVLTGSIFCDKAANVGSRKAEYRIQVLPKDTTTPADKTKFDRALAEAAKQSEEMYTPESWETFNEVYQQAKSFGALTNATQHETDVMTEELLEAMEALVLKELPFTDVTKESQQWVYEAVSEVYKRQWMTGLNKTTFGPDAFLSRAEFAVILHRIENTPEVSYDGRFKDVPDGEWYTDAVAWASKEGIINGYEGGELFGPADKISREQMAVMMYRYGKAKGYDTSAKADLEVFKDASEVSAFADQAMQWAVGIQVISGKEEGTVLDPQGNTTRAECAAILARSLHLMEN